MDFSQVIPPGVGIASASLAILTNNSALADASADWSGPSDPHDPGFFDASIEGRAVYCQMTGGVAGKDYRFVWTVVDTDGNEMARTALLLCSPTS